MATAGTARLTIGEVAKRAGVRPSAVRFYESAGLLSAPEREGGWRRYDPAVLEQLTLIQIAQKAGFTIDEIRELCSGTTHADSPSARWHALAHRKLEHVEELIQRAEEMRRWLEAGLRCASLEECDILREAVSRDGSL